MRHKLVLAATVVAVSLVAAAGAGATPVGHGHGKGHPKHHGKPAVKDTYLALGDSVAFGYVPPNAVPAPDYFDSGSFVGYPEDLAKLLKETVANASCPGETSQNMLVANTPSNGCENQPGSSATGRPTRST